VTVKLNPALAAAAAATLLVTAACGGSEADADRTAADDGAEQSFADLSAEEILDAAIEAVRDADSVRAAGGVVDDELGPIQMDISVSGDTCSGWMEMEGARADVLRAEGGSWMRADEDFWIATVGEAEGPAAASLFADMWLLDRDDNLDELCDIQDIFGDVESLADEDLEKADNGVVEIGGVQTVQVRATDDVGAVSVIYVATEEPHWVIRLDVAEEQGVMRFAEYDTIDRFAPPPAEEQVDPDGH
jgi:hypothetical protein